VVYLQADEQIYSRLWCSEGLVNKTDDFSDDSPLEGASNSLSQSEFQRDIAMTRRKAFPAILRLRGLSD
jgi:hypothetical protein